MDIAYDHIQEEVLTPDGAAEAGKNSTNQPGLNTELAQAYKAISSSPWGARLGALVGTVKKQGESYYEGARQEYAAASSQASKGLSEIINRTRSLSVTKSAPTDSLSTQGSTESPGKDGERSETTPKKEEPRRGSEDAHGSEGMFSRFRNEAFKRLKDIEKAEDAADEALLKFGANIRNFLREAVSIAPPAEGEPSTGKDGKPQVLYESKDTEGKRVIHTTRFDAQLHAIHSSMESFINDPASPEYCKWRESFEVEKKTPDIATDLERYRELRAAMEKLVPDQVKYDAFWTRYYFLRHVVEKDEQKRKELLRGASTNPDNEEEVGWDEEDSDTERSGNGPQRSAVAENPASMDSTSTLNPTTTSSSPTTNHPSAAATGDPQPAAAAAAATTATTPTDTTPEPSLKPSDSRRSNDGLSQPDSDASYDVVSGAPSHAPSRAPGSPTEMKEAKKVAAAAGDESEEEDWE